MIGNGKLISGYCSMKTGILALSVFCAPLLHAAIVDNSTTLIVPIGETYTLAGEHAYSDSIRIDGTLYVAAYSTNPRCI